MYRQQKRERKPVVGDGNCGYRALAYSFTKLQVKWEEFKTLYMLLLRWLEQVLLVEISMEVILVLLLLLETLLLSIGWIRALRKHEASGLAFRRNWRNWIFIQSWLWTWNYYKAGVIDYLYNHGSEREINTKLWSFNNNWFLFWIWLWECRSSRQQCFSVIFQVVFKTKGDELKLPYGLFSNPGSMEDDLGALTEG